ncbi:dihydrofolate reductase [Parvibaculum sp.]|uniref:dihydrofolate reductase n=1 Tax=Parvibaculum sp. TaxID=2024848 RepID=UPI0032F0814F
MTLHVSFVVAIAENGVIGRDNGLPWRLSGDMAFFKRVTMGKPVIMGRKTWESLPRKPLPGRPNIVVTRDPSYHAEGAEVATSAEAALLRGKELATGLGVDEIAVIGGAQLYAEMFDHATRLYITEVHAAPAGDVSFPAFDAARWREVSRERHEAGEKDSAPYSFVLMERRD